MDYSNCQQRAVTAAAELASHSHLQPLAISPPQAVGAVKRASSGITEGSQNEG